MGSERSVAEEPAEQTRTRIHAEVGLPASRRDGTSTLLGGVLSLQRLAGNAAVAALLGRGPLSDQTVAPQLVDPAATVQCLLAEELTHVVQQLSGPTTAPRKTVSGKKSRVIVTVKLVVRSIGKRTRAEPWSSEGHTALVFNIRVDSRDDHWLVQGGNFGGRLQGSCMHASSAGWYPLFATAEGAIWDTGESAAVPEVKALWEGVVPTLTLARLQALVALFNQSSPAYRYESGPNSNTFTHRFLQIVGATNIPSAPSDGFEIKGW